MTPGEMRAAVLDRDDYECQARFIDPEAGVCRDRWGRELSTAHGHHHSNFEADYVKRGAHDKRHRDPRDHVTLCAFHHQGSRAGYIWATAHRQEMRAWLERKEAA